jgi:hypothetical protein
MLLAGRALKGNEGTQVHRAFIRDRRSVSSILRHTANMAAGMLTSCWAMAIGPPSPPQGTPSIEN